MAFKRSPVLLIVAVNLVIAALWGVSLVLDRAGVPFLTIVFGTLALAAPGLTMVLALEQLAQTKTKPLFLLLWVVMLSLVITPAASYAISLAVLKQSPVIDIVTPFLIWWAACVAAAAVVALVKHQPLDLRQFLPDRITRREITYVVVGFAAIMVVNFVVFPLLPEGDGYEILIKWQNIKADPKLLAAETRSLFLITFHLISQLLKIDPYWIFKALLPLAHVTMVIACYLFARNFVADRRLRILVALAPLYFPVILQETLISRPQSILLISFLPSLVIIADILSNRDNLRRVYWLVALFAVGAVGTKTHTLFAGPAFVGLISIIIFLKREIAKRPLDSFLIACVLSVLFYPWLLQSRVIADPSEPWHLIKVFLSKLRESHFEIWFLDHYQNIEGKELGWPGISAVFYYGYNLGLAFPILLAWLLIRKGQRVFRDLVVERYWAVIFLFSFFISIAEIAPRFQVAFLPDRAWLFLALIFALVFSLIMRELRKNAGPRFFVLSGTICLLSVLAGTGLTYAKQGWVTRDEVKAAEFIKTQTPEDAIFLGQGSTNFMVHYYGRRTHIRPDDEVFLTGEPSLLEQYLQADETPVQQTLRSIPIWKSEVNEKLTEIAGEFIRPNLTESELAALFEKINAIYLQKDNFFVSVDTENKQISPAGPVYLVYNRNKFNSLYGWREWWRKSNFYGANLERLNANFPVVYNENGITIWEAKQ